ncbi:hypothetical protein K438DRAFT_2099690 [Mycena galopus ATCC 62051]|nr:hypothetical protein K438DRAFT_2099690 [Mycena galopus ATCC 62051]
MHLRRRSCSWPWDARALALRPWSGVEWNGMEACDGWRGVGYVYRGAAGSESELELDRRRTGLESAGYEICGKDGYGIGLDGLTWDGMGLGWDRDRDGHWHWHGHCGLRWVWIGNNTRNRDTKTWRGVGVCGVEMKGKERDGGGVIIGSVRVGRFDVSEVVSAVVSDVVSEVVSENCWHQKRGKKRPWIYLAGETTSETMQKLLRRSFCIVSEAFLVSPTL